MRIYPAFLNVIQRLHVVSFSVFVFSLVLLNDVAAQEISSEARTVNTLINAVKHREEALAPEKLFLHFDKPYYATGDTIWYKAYLQNAHLQASDKSGLMYLELVNEKDSAMYRRMIPVVNGLTHGDLHLENYPEGNYTLRAYTNWMRNFSESYIFKKQFYISEINPKQWFVKYKTNLSKTPENNLRVNFGFNTLDNQPVGLRELQLRVLAGKKELVRSEVTTSVDGLLDVNFKIPETKERISVIAKDLRKGAGEQVLTIPLRLDRIENTDVQFMPEGGKLVSGIETKVGFKAINELGKGVNVEGEIYDSSNRLITSFKTVHAGMGSVTFLPLAAETYTAKVKLSESVVKSYSLPKISHSGTAIKVVDLADSLQISITGSADLIGFPATYYLVGQSRGLICYAAQFVFKNNKRVFTIAKALFPSGILHVVLLNARYQPLNERLFYIKGSDELSLNLTLHQEKYAVRDSINLSLTAKDTDGNPISGSFSLTVTDDNLVKPDSAINHNILTAMLLTSELKGEVEYPGYYFQKDREQELDALLLTQGWVAYPWDDLFKHHAKPAFEAEKKLVVKGRVLNIFDKPLANVPVHLTSNWPPVKKEVRTDSIGSFVFKNFPVLDSAMFHLKALNRNNKSYNVGIKVDEFIPPVFKKELEVMPWYVNADDHFQKVANLVLKQRETYNKLTGVGVLKEVVIKGRRVVKGSKNLNGPGVADFVLDATDMLKAKKLTLLQLLELRMPGFRNTGYSFAIKNRSLQLIIDGIYIDETFTEEERRRRYPTYKGFLQYLTAEDIKGIELVVLSNVKYFQRFIDPLSSPADFAFIEITTMNGRGPFFKATPGTYFYRPMPFAWPKQFYSPKYRSKSNPLIPDLRSTIHWEPNIVTNSSGKASLSFYAADKPGSYTLTLQGADMGGKLGYITKKITIK